MKIERLREELQRAARITRRAERAITLVDRGLANRVKIAPSIKSALFAAAEKFENELFGGEK